MDDRLVQPLQTFDRKRRSAAGSGTWLCKPISASNADGGFQVQRYEMPH
jgi:hypothetical protein